MAGQFIYERIASCLRESILKGEFAPGDKLPSARDLSVQYETSQITANKALNQLVSEGFIKRSTGSGSVVIHANGPSAASVSGLRNTRLIGVIVFDISHPFWAGTIRGIEEECRHNGYNLLVGNDEGSLKKAESYITNFLARGVEGLIFVPIGTKDMPSYENENRRLLEIIERTRIPYVLLHRNLDTFAAPIAELENYRSAYEATRLLVKQGVRNPICISHYFSQVVQDRERGFIDALTDAGFKHAQNRVYHLHPLGQTVDIRELHEIYTLMKEKDDIDGVFTIAADMLAILIQAMQQSHSWQDVKVVSFDFNRSLFRHRNIIAMLETPSVMMGMQSGVILFRAILNGAPYRMQTKVYPIFHIKKDLFESLDGQGYLVEQQVQLHD
jgi:LacI family transcriptional regulator